MAKRKCIRFKTVTVRSKKGRRFKAKRCAKWSK